MNFGTHRPNVGRRLVQAVDRRSPRGLDRLCTAHLWTSGDGQDELVWRLIPMCRDVVRDAFRRRESAPTVWDEQVGREERPSMLTEATFLTAEIKKRLPRPVCEGLQALEELRVNRPR